MELLVDDLILVDDTFFRKKKFFMISESRDKFIRLTKEQYAFYSEIIQCIKSSSNEQELDTKIKKISNGQLSIDEIVNTLKKYNLLASSVSEEKRKIEAELSGTKLREYRLDRIQDKFKVIMKYIWCGINIAMIAMLIYIVSVLVLNKIDLSVGLANSSFNAVKSGSINIFVLIFGSFFALLGHEMGHLLSANYNKVGWKSVNFILKFGLLFSCYIRYKNFHAYSSKIKVRVLLAGIYMNLFQSCFWFILYLHMKEFNYIALVAMNVLCILSNIQPKGTSDGYQLICITFGVEGIRWRMLKLVSNIMKNPKLLKDIFKNKQYVFYILYFLVSYGLIIWTCIALFFNIMSYINVMYKLKYIVLISMLIGITMIALFINNLMKFIKNLKSF